MSVNKSRDAFDPNAMGYAKDGEGRGRPHARAGRQSRPRIGVKPFGNGQIGPIALSLGLPWGATQGCTSLRALVPICRVRTRDLSTDKLLVLNRKSGRSTKDPSRGHPQPSETQRSLCLAALTRITARSGSDVHADRIERTIMPD